MKYETRQRLKSLKKSNSSGFFRFEKVWCRNEDNEEWQPCLFLKEENGLYWCFTENEEDLYSSVAGRVFKQIKSRKG